jgi:hypothetical protein
MFICGDGVEYEVYIAPGFYIPDTATNVLPSAEQAAEVHS